MFSKHFITGAINVDDKQNLTAPPAQQNQWQQSHAWEKGSLKVDVLFCSRFGVFSGDGLQSAAIDGNLRRYHQSIAQMTFAFVKRSSCCISTLLKYLWSHFCNHCGCFCLLIAYCSLFICIEWLLCVVVFAVVATVYVAAADSITASEKQHNIQQNTR